MFKTKRKITFFVFLLIFFSFLIFMRSARMIADPPADLSWSGGYYGDESGYAQNARNKVIFGKWSLDDWKIHFFNPILVFFDYLSFKLFGPSFFSLRLVALFWGIIGIASIYGTLNEKSKSIWLALLGTILLETNYYFLMFTRLSLTDMMLTNWMLMTLFFWAVGLRRAKFRFLAGLSSVGVIGCKPTAVYFSLIILASFAFNFLNENVRDDSSIPDEAFVAHTLKIVRYTLPFIIGFTLGFSAWFFLFHFPYHEEITKIASSWAKLSMPKDFWEFVKRTVGTHAPIVFEHFSWFPFIFLLGWLYLPVSFYRLLTNRRKYNSLEFLALLWFVIGYFALSGFRYRPSRYFLSLVPPITILSLFALKQIFRFRMNALKKNRIFWVLYSGWFLLCFYLINRHFSIKFPVIPVLSSGLALFCVLTGMAWILKGTLINKKYTRKLSFYVILLFASISLSLNLSLYYKWWHKPSYNVAHTSREIGKIVKNGVIAGLWAPMICMENKNRALCIASGWGNDDRPYEKYKFTHLFLWKGNHNTELRFCLKKPLGTTFIKEKLLLIRTFFIKDAQAVLYEILP